MIGGYFDPTFEDRVKALVEKIGKAWDNDPRVAYIEMGIIGQWGEQHSPMIGTYWKPHDADVHEANKTWIRESKNTGRCLYCRVQEQKSNGTLCL